MWLSFFAVILILAITFYQGLHGLFSAMIMCILTVLSAALAFGMHDAIYHQYLIASQPDRGRALALLGVFIVVLIVSRVIVDIVISKNMRFLPIVEKIGGGVFGFVTAIVIVGTLASGFQMLPFGGNVLGFERYSLTNADGTSIYPKNEEEVKAKKLERTDWLSVTSARHNLLFNPDGLTVLLMNALSSNALGMPGEKSLAQAHPDLLDEAHYLRANPLGQTRITAPSGGISLEAVWDFDDKIYQRTKGSQSGTIELKVDSMVTNPDPGMRRLAARVRFNNSAVEEGGLFRFTIKQIVLIGEQGNRIYPFAMSDMMLRSKMVTVPAFEPLLLDTKPVERQNVVKTEPILDFVFDVPDDFVPAYVVYKGGADAKVTLPDAADKKAKSPKPLPNAYTLVVTPAEKSNPAANVEPKTPERPKTVGSDAAKSGTNNGGGNSSNTTENPIKPKNPGGRTHNFNISEDKPIFTDLLPFELTNYSLSGGEASVNGVLKSGSLKASLEDDWTAKSGTKPKIDRLEVPEGFRVLQLYTDSIRAGSFYGQAMEFAERGVSNLYVEDETGKPHPAVGRWAVATVGSAKRFELIYLGEEARDAGRVAPPLSSIKSTHMKDPAEYSYVFLFHIPVGRQAMKFHTGRKEIPLDEYKLVATED